AGRSGHAVTLHNYGAIVERPMWLEDGAQQIARDDSVEAHPALRKGPQPGFSLHDDQGADLLLRKLARGEQDLFGYLPALELSEPGKRAPSDASEHSPDLRLEHHDDRETRKRGQSRKQRAEQFE